MNSKTETSLKGCRIAMLATDGFEEVELTGPKQRLEAAGATVEILAPQKTLKDGEIRGWRFKEWGDAIAVDRAVGEVKPEDYDALVLPGGVINPDRLRIDEKSVDFVKAFAVTGKPLAAICHGPLTLINAGLVQDRQMTSWPSISLDLKNAGARWKDQDVVTDGQFITSRKPEDIPAFSNAIIDAVAQARH
jgi:protease I